MHSIVKGCQSLNVMLLGSTPPSLIHISACSLAVHDMLPLEVITGASQVMESCLDA